VNRSSEDLWALAAVVSRAARALTYLRILRAAGELQQVARELDSLARACCKSTDDPSSGVPGEP
jgi:hypothetical protein